MMCWFFIKNLIHSKQKPPRDTYQPPRCKAEREWVPKSFNFNVFNFQKLSADYFRETIRHLEKIIRHLEKTTKHLEKIRKHLVGPSSGLFFGKSGQKKPRKPCFYGKSSVLHCKDTTFFSEKQIAKIVF